MCSHRQALAGIRRCCPALVGAALAACTTAAWGDIEILVPIPGTNRFTPFWDMMKDPDPVLPAAVIQMTHSPLSLSAGSSTPLEQYQWNAETSTLSGPTLVNTPTADQEYLVSRLDRINATFDLAFAHFVSQNTVIDRPSGEQRISLQFWDANGASVAGPVLINVGAATTEFSETSAAVMARSLTEQFVFVGAELKTPVTAVASGIYRVDYVNGVKVSEVRVSNNYDFQLTARNNVVVGQRNGTIHTYAVNPDTGEILSTQQFTGVESQTINQYAVSDVLAGGEFLLAYQFFNGPNFAGGTGVVVVNGAGTFGKTTSPLKGYQPSGFVSVPGIVNLSDAGLSGVVVVSDVAEAQLAQLVGPGGEAWSVPIDVSRSTSGVVNPQALPTDGKFLPKGFSYQSGGKPTAYFAWLNDTTGPGETVAGQKFSVFADPGGGPGRLRGGNDSLVGLSFAEASRYSLKYSNTFGTPGQSLTTLGLNDFPNGTVVDNPFKQAGDPANQVWQATPNAEGQLFKSREHVFSAWFDALLGDVGSFSLTDPAGDAITGVLQFSMAGTGFSGTDVLRASVHFNLDSGTQTYFRELELDELLKESFWNEIELEVILPPPGDPLYGSLEETLIQVELALLESVAPLSFQPLLASGTFYLDNITFGLAVEPTVIPEPATGLILAGAGIGLMCRRVKLG